jgi:hypothetical protein
VTVRREVDDPDHEPDRGQQEMPEEHGLGQATEAFELCVLAGNAYAVAEGQLTAKLAG